MGAAIAWLLLSGNTFGPGPKESSVVAQLRVTPELGSLVSHGLARVASREDCFPRIRAAGMRVTSTLKVG